MACEKVTALRFCCFAVDHLKKIDELAGNAVLPVGDLRVFNIVVYVQVLLYKGEEE